MFELNVINVNIDVFVYKDVMVILRLRKIHN